MDGGHLFVPTLIVVIIKTFKGMVIPVLVNQGGEAYLLLLLSMHFRI